jgi:hypothetical protein
MKVSATFAVESVWMPAARPQHRRGPQPRQSHSHTAHGYISTQASISPGYISSPLEGPSRRAGPCAVTVDRIQLPSRREGSMFGAAVCNTLLCVFLLVCLDFAMQYHYHRARGPNGKWETCNCLDSRRGNCKMCGSSLQSFAGGDGH